MGQGGGATTETWHGQNVHPFQTIRNQRPGLARCYFVELAGEVKPGRANEVQITLPIRTGLVFSGAYVDLPDQVPAGLQPGLFVKMIGQSGWKKFHTECTGPITVGITEASGHRVHRGSRENASGLPVP